MSVSLETETILQERYLLLEQLGNNSGRQTWLAQDLQLNERVTVKLLAFNSQMQWDEFKLFEREASVLKQLHHPRIPQYRDYFCLEQPIGAGLSWFALVQDYIPGQSLRQLLDRGKRFTESQVRFIAKQVLEILVYLHGLNPPVLHRDIKPSNLILGKNKQVYLVDFGAVQDSAAVEGVTFTVVGTSGYAPLEQFWGQAVPASDLYALGATLIHLLTGISPADLPQQNLRIQFRDQVSVQPQLISWIEALIEPDLEVRLSRATQALNALATGHSISYPLQTINTPFSTEIKLKISPVQLIIQFPARPLRWLVDIFALGFKLIILIVLGFSSVLFTLIILISLLHLLFCTSLKQIIFNLGFIILSLYLFKSVIKHYKDILPNVKQTIISKFCSYTIIFNRQTFTCHGLKFFLLLSEIHGVKQDIKSHSIYLKTRTANYYLAHRLTQSELNWLACEIQDWLANC